MLCWTGMPSTPNDCSSRFGSVGPQPKPSGRFGRSSVRSRLRGRTVSSCTTYSSRAHVSSRTRRGSRRARCSSTDSSARSTTESGGSASLLCSPESAELWDGVSRCAEGVVPSLIANLHSDSDHYQDGAVESLPNRSVEQEVAAGRAASTPVAMIGGVIVVIGALFAIVLSLVVLAYALS